MDTLSKAASPPGKYRARPISRMGDSPHAVSNQRKGSRFSARPLNQPRGFEPGTSSLRGGRFTHCATWTPSLTQWSMINKWLSTEIGGQRWQAASTLSNQLFYHSPDDSHSAQLDDVWILNAPSSMLPVYFLMAVRQPTCQVFDHWILDTCTPAGILSPHLPSVGPGLEARKLVDVECWRATLDNWKNSVYQSIQSGVDLDPIDNLVTLAGSMHKHF